MLDLNKKLDEIEEIEKNYKDYIEGELSELKKEYSIINSETLSKTINEMDLKDRDLKIGIVGRVKAGKSSLLNSLFFDGEDILPKAATPMTAALTVIKYGEEFKASVYFYTADDINNIIADSKEYDEKYNTMYDAEYNKLKGKVINEDERKKIADSKTKRKLKQNVKLDSAKDQYERMKKSPQLLRELSNKENGEDEKEDLLAKDVAELQHIMMKYVGADGEYMPFTKNITVQLPIEKLKNVQIIDTPGVNDPVMSREERTRQLLKDCDVTLVISPSGQFLSEDDKELMGRISNKEGISEIYIISSQIDNILFSSEKNENNSEIDKILESVKSKLSKQMREVVSKLDENQKSDVYKKLKDEGEIVLTSGICANIANNLKKNKELPEDQSHVYNNLKKLYPDYFNINDKASIMTLEKIANINEVYNMLEDIKKRKNEILSKRKNEYLESKENSFNAFKEDLMDAVLEKSERLDNVAVDDLKNELKKIENKKLKLQDEIEEMLEDKIQNELYEKLSTFISSKVSSIENDINSILNANTSYETEEYQVEKKGFFSGITRLFGVGGYETRTRSYQTLDTNMASNQLISIVRTNQIDISSDIETILRKFKKAITLSTTRKVSEILGEDEIEYVSLKRQIKLTVTNIEIKNIDLDIKLSDGLKGMGILMNNSYIQRYKNMLFDFLRSLPPTYKIRTKKFIDNISENLTASSITSKILNDLEGEREKLINQIENKEETKKIYSELIDKLKEL